MMIVLCECNLGIEDLEKLPPHYHYRAGLAQMPDGRKEWIAGIISQGHDGVTEECEQKEFVDMQLRLPVEEMVQLFGG